MAPQSMTGFARREGHHGAIRWFWEIRSVNGRGLDVRMKLGAGNEALETIARKILREQVARGSIQVFLGVSRDSETPRLKINHDAVDVVLAGVREVREKHDVAPLSMDGLLGIRGVVEIAEEEESDADIEARLKAMANSFAETVADLVAARTEEGARMCAILEEQLSRISSYARKAADAPSRRPENIKARLTEQIDRLLAAAVDLDPERLHQESMMLAAKVDIQEEIDRLEAHVEAASELLASAQPIGRKLEFLTQEFNREANTLCSKSNHVDLTAIGMELKVVVDQLREQVQNIE